jgi:hypothetical protein
MDLHKVTTLSCIKFADDSNFIGIANTSTLLERMVNTELSKIYDWFLYNRLTIHPDKSRYMIHSKKGYNIKLRTYSYTKSRKWTTKRISLIFGTIHR